MANRMMKFCESQIDPTQFEYFVCALFTALGYSVEHNGKTHDGGIDIFVRHYQRGKGVVQVKQYRNSKVTEPQIRDLYGALCAKQEVEYGIMVVLSDCTKEAKTWPDREGVTNLAIWTHKELVSMLQQKGNEILLEFIGILNQNHDRDLKHAQSGMFVTPKHQRQKQANPFYKKPQSVHGIHSQHGLHFGANSNSNSNGNYNGMNSHSIPSSIGCTKPIGRRRETPSSTLSSAKKRGVKAKNDRNNQVIATMAKQWAQCKFTVNEEPEADREGGAAPNEEKDGLSPLRDNRDVENRHDPPSPDKQLIFGGDSRSGFDGEISPNSTHSNSADSSLLIDESQSDDENHSAMTIKHKTPGFAAFADISQSALNGSISNGIVSSSSMSMSNQNDAVSINTNLMWSISNVNKARRKRRPWLPVDDQLILNGIASMDNWMETTEQWDVIYSRNKAQFSQNWTLKDVRKHYHRALKPKLMSHQNQVHQTSSNHSSHSHHSHH